MKTKIIILCVLIVCSKNLMAMEEDGKYFFYWNIGFVNNELSHQDDNPYISYIFSTQLLNYYMDNRIITFEISPFKYWFFGENKVHKITFFNFNMQLNLLGPRDPRLFGPIISINWLESETLTNFNIENYTLSF